MNTVNQKEEAHEKSEQQLFEQYSLTKDQKLRDEIVNRYLYIAEILTKKFLNRGADYDDIYQVACIGLIQAIQRYDHTKGVKFTSFATPTIVGEIKRYFRDKGNLIRIPRRIYEIYQKVNIAKQTLSQTLDRAPNVQEIASYLKLPQETILEVIESSNVTGIQSLEQSIYAEDETALHDMIGQEDATFEKIENHDFIERSVKDFGEIEKLFIRHRYYDKKTQKQIANILGVSQMYVSRMERKILKKLKMMYEKSVDL